MPISAASTLMALAYSYRSFAVSQFRKESMLIPTRDEADSRGGFPNREKSESMGADDGGSGSWVQRSDYVAIMMGQC